MLHNNTQIHYGSFMYAEIQHLCDIIFLDCTFFDCPYKRLYIFASVNVTDTLCVQCLLIPLLLHLQVITNKIVRLCQVRGGGGGGGGEGHRTKAYDVLNTPDSPDS